MKKKESDYIVLKNDLSKKMLDVMKDLKQQDQSVVEEESVWEETEEVQNNFDDKLSEYKKCIVENGRMTGTGSGLRDILLRIDEKNEEIESFNVLDHYKKLVNNNKLNEFNNINNAYERFVETDQEHIVYKTEFDRIVYEENNYDISEYSKLKNNNIEIINSLKKIFLNKFNFFKRDRFKHNQEEGKLDNRVIWKLASKSDDVRLFEKTITKHINKNVASIVLDISGSMDKDFSLNGLHLKELALIISEALTECKIDHEILGIHAPICDQMLIEKASSLYNRKSNLLETVVYKRFENKKNYGITNININATDNSDGEHLKNVAKRLMKRNAKNKMIFYISDGKPYLSDANVSILDNDLKKTVAFLKTSKVQLYSLGFNNEPFEFYDNYLKVNDYKDLLTYFKKI